jgi:hypothetical protein
MACAAVVAVVASGPASAQTYDAYKNFNLKKNPDGAWSYLVAGDLLSTKLPSCASISKFICWWNDGNEPDSAVVGANKTGMAISWATITLPAKYLVLDPESNNNVAVQWTAPAAGTLEVTGNFLGADHDEASHTVAILQNTTTLKSYTISSYGQKEKFHLSVQVDEGDTISFVSYTNGWTYLSTGLQANLTLN